MGSKRYPLVFHRIPLVAYCVDFCVYMWLLVVSPMSALRVGGMGLMWYQVQSVLVSLINREVSVLLGIMLSIRSH